MADGDINYGLGLDIAQAQAEIAKLKSQLDGLTKSFTETSTRISGETNRLTADLARQIARLKSGTDEALRAERRMGSARGQAISSQSQGSERARIENASISRISNEMRTQADAVTARLADEAVKVFALKLRNINKAVDARLRLEVNRVEQMIANSSEDFLRASSTRSNYNRYRTIRDYGDDALLGARDSRDRRRNSQLIEDEGNSGLQQARLVQRRQRNQQLQERYLDQEALRIDQMARQQASILKRERVESFEERRRLAEERRQQAVERARERAARAEERAAQQRERNANRELNAARETVKSYNERRTIQRASNIERFGTPQAPASVQRQNNLDSTLERIGSNGGADIMAVQTRLMLGYQTLSLAFNTARSMGTFVVELDKEFRNFQAITGTTNSEMGTLKDRLIDVSEATRFTALEIAKASTTMAQAGLSAKAVGDTIGSIALLATAAGTDLNSAVDVVTSTMSIFNLQTSQASDIANTLTGALNDSKLTLDQVTLGLQYSGNIAAQTGISYKELVATLGAMANSGIRSGSTLGTGLRQLLTDIQNPSKKFTETLRQLKLSQQDVDISSRGLVPVLKTLQEAGFTTGQAFEAFEVRAAAAYAALSNNLDLIPKLQESFILSSAAIEANDVQMKSLANTWAKFQSVIGTLASTAFEPVLQVLQKLLDSASEVLSALRDYPSVLKLIGVGLAGIGAGLVVTQAVAFTRAILILSGVTKAFGASAATTAAQVGVMEAATVTASRSMGVLNVVTRANPWIMLAAAVATAVTAFGDFGNAADHAAENVDKIKGELNTLQGTIDDTEQQTSAINQTIENLMNQKAALDKDPVLRRAKIFEIITDFKELAGTVDASTTSVKQLAEALDKLREAKIRIEVGAIGQQILTQDDLIKAREKELSLREQGVAATASGNVVDSQGNPLGVQGINDRMVRQVGEDFRKVIEFINAPLTNLPEGPDTLYAFQNQIAQRRNSLQNEQFGLEQSRRRGTLDTDGQQRMAQISSMLEGLDIIEKSLKDISPAAFDIFKTRLDRDLNKDNLASKAVETLPGFQDILTQARERTAALNEQLANVMKNKKGSDLLPSLLDLQRQAEQTMKDLNTQADSFAESVPGQLGPEFNADKVKNIAKNAISQILVKFQSTMTGNITAIQEKTSKLIEAQQKANDKTLSKQVEGELKTARASNQTDEVEAIKTTIHTLMDARRKIVNDIFEAKMAAAKDDFEKEELTTEHKEALATLDEAEEQHIESLNTRIKDITDDYLQWTQGSIESSISELKKRISEATTQLSKLRPGAAFDALNNAITSMIDELSRLQNDAAGVQSRRDALSGKTVLDPGAAVGNNMLDLIAYAEGTGNNYNETLDRGRWTGGPVDLVNMTLKEVLALQKRMLADPANRAKYGNGRGSSAVGRYQIVSQTLEGLIKEMGLTGDEKFSPIMQNAMARRLIARRGNNVDNLRNEWEGLRRIDGGRITEAMNSWGVETPEVQEANRERQEAASKAAVRDVKATTDAIVRSDNKDISALMAQAKTLSNPDGVKSLISSVDAKYKEIIEQKTKAFDKANEAALKENDPEVQVERSELIDGLKSERNQKIMALFEQFQRASEEAADRAVQNAQNALEVAQRPENAGKYTSSDIANLEGNVQIAERKAQVDKLHASEQMLLMVRQQLAATPDGSDEHTFWLTQEAEIKQRLVDLTNAKTAADDAQSRAQYGVSDAIKAANDNYLVQIGLMQRIPGEGLKMVPVAQQVGEAWAEVLPQLENSFSSLFQNLASGTMSTTEAFRKFGQDILSIFMSLIAKKLAQQLMASLIPTDTGSGGGFIGELLSGIFSVPGQANGGGIRGAAVGETISGPVTTRDSVIRKVQPGEFILRQSAAKAVGKDALEALNNQGNRKMSADGVANDNQQQQGGGVVNVWVVSQDQVPPPGPNDIVATVADNIQRRGTLKQLIQSVQMGAI